MNSARIKRTVHELRGDWHEIGGLSRLALVGLIAALGLTIALGFSITRSVRAQLLAAQAELLANEIGALPLPEGMQPGTPDFEAYDSLVRQELIGGATERVKLWNRSGEVIYSDKDVFVGEVFDLSEDALVAFEGTVSVNISALTDPAHQPDKELGHLIEFYIPVRNEADEVIAVFEIEQSTDSLDHAIVAISRNVWTSIGIGVLVVGLFMATLGVASARDLNQRRRAAESLLGRRFTAQEEERKRIVGALHDDIGQPLYRILYGLEGSIARIGQDSDVGRELEALQGMIRNVDHTLRSELVQLSEHLAIDAGLDAALEELVETTTEETDLTVSLFVADTAILSDVQRAALYRVAQEGVVNVRKHADATVLIIEAHRSGPNFEVRVRDDGHGSGPVVPGLGLTTSRERMEALGGDLSFVSTRDGAELVAHIPVRQSFP